MSTDNTTAITEHIHDMTVYVYEKQKFQGRTMKEWSQYIKIPIAPDANPLHIKGYLVQLYEKLGEIDSMLQSSKFTYSSLESYESTSFQEETKKIIAKAKEENKKISMAAAERIASDTLLATRKKKDMAKNIFVFFQGLQKQLHKTFEILNTTNVAEGYLQRIERQGL